MRILTMKFGLPCSMRIIGSVGESGATLLVVDVSEVERVYTDAAYSVVAKREAEPPCVVADNLSAVDGQLLWAVDRQITRQVGAVDIEIHANQGAALMTGATWPFHVRPGVGVGCDCGCGGSGGAANETVVEYPSFADLPQVGKAGILYLIAHPDGTATTYAWAGTPPDYVSTSGGSTSGIAPFTIIDCRP